MKKLGGVLCTIFGIATLFAAAALAQVGSPIYVTVVDESGHGILRASVSMREKGYAGRDMVTSISDEDGVAEFHPLADASRHTLIFTIAKQGFAHAEFQQQVELTGEAYKFRYTLTRAGSASGGVKAALTIEVYDDADLKPVPTAKVTVSFVGEDSAFGNSAIDAQGRSTVFNLPWDRAKQGVRLLAIAPGYKDLPVTIPESYIKTEGGTYRVHMKRGTSETTSIAGGAGQPWRSQYGASVVMNPDHTGTYTDAHGTSPGTWNQISNDRIDFTIHRGIDAAHYPILILYFDKGKLTDRFGGVYTQ